MRGSEQDVLREAARDVHPNESFEKALGRAVRNHGGTYEDYLALIARVRKRAAKDKVPLRDAARTLASAPPRA